MQWIKVKIDTNKAGIDFISQIFEECGIVSLEIEDNVEFLQVLEQTRSQWDFVEDELYREKSKARHLPHPPPLPHWTGGDDKPQMNTD